MVSSKEIQAACDDIVHDFSPLQIILFGSYAYGTPTEESDVDLLVVLPIPKSEFRNKAAEIRQSIPYRFGMDLLVRSPEEIAYRVSCNDWFLREITEKGKILHGPCTDYNIIKLHNIPCSVEKGKVPMNPLTLEWIEKAEEDWISAKWLQESPNPVYNAICFHVQQSIEKYLKAWLQEKNIPFSKTHDFVDLLYLILPSQPNWNIWLLDLKIITTYAVASRYPGDPATDEDTKHAIQICSKIRQTVRTQLNLDT